MNVARSALSTIVTDPEQLGSLAMRMTLLAGDIGGTKTILRLVDSEVPGSASEIPSQTTLCERSYDSRAYTDLVPMVHRFLEDATGSLGNAPGVKRACFGIAGPVINNTSELTNLSWSLSAERLGRELAISRITLINDFTAIGYGIPGLSATDIITLQSVAANPDAPRAILGAGTGLGQGFSIPYPDGSHRVFATEGGHADFAPRSSLEFQLLMYLQEKNHLERVSVERVVSGQGITSIYQFLRDSNPSEESPGIAQLYQRWLQEIGKEEKTVDLAAAISKAALDHSDFLCQQTMKLFIEAYGAEAGNLALKILPYGGLYIAGGIAVKILPLMQQGAFMNAFRNKGRMRPVLEKIPVYVIVNPRAGLIGAALRAAQ
jgi:glucokinase